MPKSSWSVPPDHINNPEEFRNYSLELHNIILGLGDDVSGGLDSDNIPDSTISGNSTVAALSAVTHTQGKDQSLDLGGLNEVLAVDAKDAVDKKHDPLGNHKVMVQAVALVDSATSSVSVDSVDATDLSTVITLANETKSDVNTIVSDLNVAIDVLNNLLVNLRSAKIQAS